VLALAGYVQHLSTWRFGRRCLRASSSWTSAHSTKPGLQTKISLHGLKQASRQ